MIYDVANDTIIITFLLFNIITQKLKKFLNFVYFFLKKRIWWNQHIPAESEHQSSFDGKNCVENIQQAQPSPSPVLFHIPYLILD